MLSASPYGFCKSFDLMELESGGGLRMRFHAGYAMLRQSSTKNIAQQTQRIANYLPNVNINLVILRYHDMSASLAREMSAFYRQLGASAGGPWDEMGTTLCQSRESEKSTSPECPLGFRNQKEKSTLWQKGECHRQECAS